MGITTTPIVWSDSFSVGINAIDEDHQKLLALLNRCINAMETEDRKEEIRAILVELLDYARTHFRREEAVMEACAYQGLDGHRQMHVLLVNDVKKQYWQLIQGELNLDKMVAFLSNWLVDHIQNKDMAYAPYCEGKADLIAQALEQAGPVPGQRISS